MIDPNKLKLPRRWFLKSLAGALTVVAIEAAAVPAGKFRMARPGTTAAPIPPPGTDTLTPDANWDGTAGSSLAFHSINTDESLPARTSGKIKPVLRGLSMDRCAASGQWYFYYQARLARHLYQSANNGLTLQGACDGPLQTLNNAPAVYTVTDRFGNTRKRTCRRVAVDALAATGLHASGVAKGVIVATPVKSSYSGLTLISRTITFTIYPRLALDRQAAAAGAQTAGYEFDVIIDVDCNQGAAASVSGTTATFLYDPGTLSNGMTVKGAGITATTISSVTKQWDGTSAVAVLAASQSTIARVSLLLNAGTDVAGVTYYDDATHGAVEKAQGYLNANTGYVLAGIRNLRTGNYRYDTGATGVTPTARTTWTWHFPKTGITPMLGDRVNFQNANGGHTNFDRIMFDSWKLDLRQIATDTSKCFRLFAAASPGIAFTNNEIFCGSDAFGDTLSSGAGMTTLYNGSIPSSYWISYVDAGLIDIHFYNNYVHDLGCKAWVSNSSGRIVCNTVQDISGSSIIFTTSAIHGNSIKRNAGFWSKLRSYWPMMQLTGPSGSRFGVVGFSGNAAQVALFETTDTAWTPNSGTITTSSGRQAIPSSAGSAEGHVLWIGNPNGGNMWGAIGDSAVTAVDRVGSAPTIGTPPTTFLIPAGGGYISLAGTETHIALITEGSAVSGVTLLKSVKDASFQSGANPVSTVTTALAAYHSVDARYNAADITPAHPTDPVLDAAFLTANFLSSGAPTGASLLTPPTVINGSPFANGSTPGTLYCWVDQHGDMFAPNGGNLTCENVLLDYNDMDQIVAANLLEMVDTWNDACVANNTGMDDDDLVYAFGAGASLINGTGSHFFIEDNSFSGTILTTGSHSADWVQGDAACNMDGNSFYGLSGVTAFCANVTNNRLGKGTSLPSWADATTCSTTAGDETTRYASVHTTTANENNPPDFTPKSPLLLNDGVTYAGAVNGDGTRKLLAA